METKHKPTMEPPEQTLLQYLYLIPEDIVSILPMCPIAHSILLAVQLRSKFSCHIEISP